MEIGLDIENLVRTNNAGKGKEDTRGIEEKQKSPKYDGFQE